MTDDELKAIAARVRPHAAGNLGNAAIADRNALAAAWLAEHPADDAEPITAEWLAALPTAFAVDLAWHGHGPETAWLADGESGRIGVRFCRYEKAWEAYLCNADDFDGRERYLTAVPTRGHLRRLCAALGQPLRG